MTSEREPGQEATRAQPVGRTADGGRRTVASCACVALCIIWYSILNIGARTTSMPVRSASLMVQRPGKTLRELALARMRDALLDNHFKPGERLVERDLCDQLGVSRTVVREVLRHLESEGLVSTVGTRGPVVAQTTPEQAMQIYEIRGALEGMAARACALKGDSATTDGLQEMLDRIKSAYARNRMDLVLDATYAVLRAAVRRRRAGRRLGHRQIAHCAHQPVAFDDHPHPRPAAGRSAPNADRRRRYQSRRWRRGVQGRPGACRDCFADRALAALRRDKRLAPDGSRKLSGRTKNLLTFILVYHSTILEINGNL